MGIEIKLLKKFVDFTLDVEWSAGDEITVLLGHSGSGKSLTVHSIAGLITPDEGYIRVNGETLFDSSAQINLPAQKRCFGCVFQHSNLFPHMTVKGNIEYALKGMARKEKEQKTEEIMTTFQLNDLARSYPQQISGGQKQKVAFARSLVRQPHALLLDEPFSSLDSSLRSEMRRLLKRIKIEFDIPIILVTHDILEAYTISEKIIVYSGGKIEQQGDPMHIFSNPDTEAVKKLVNTQIPI